MDIDELPPLYVALIVACANEGLPIAATARVLTIPFDAVELHLKEALTDGRISTLPRADWPPTARVQDRVPALPRLSREQVELAGSTIFKLTPLEASFLGALLQYDHTDKERLHGIVETKRQSRQSRVDTSEPTDPRIVDVMICKLRKKLKVQNPNFVIGTTWGRGYSIDPAIKRGMLDALTPPRT